MKTRTMILNVSCPDRRGIVACVSSFLYRHGANIVHADEHKDMELNLFFMRVEWEDFITDKTEFCKKFSSIASELKMHWNVSYSDERTRIVIFVSKELHCLNDLLYRYKTKELDCEVSFILSNHPDARTLAEFYGIPFHKVDIGNSKDEVEKQILLLLKQNDIDLVVLAKYMQILSPRFIQEFEKPIINIHHSFLPAFVGAKPYHQAFARGVKIIGATSHYVTEGLDSGPIIEQDVARVSHRDTVKDFVQKGHDVEKIVLSRAVRWHIEHKVLVYANKTVVFD